MRKPAMCIRCGGPIGTGEPFNVYQQGFTHRLTITCEIESEKARIEAHGLGVALACSSPGQIPGGNSQISGTKLPDRRDQHGNEPIVSSTDFR